MKIITKKIEKQLLATPIGTHCEVMPKDIPIIFKLFSPWSGWTWFVTEGDRQPDGDWELYGMVHGDFKEIGPFMLSELTSITGPAGLKIERDLHYKGKTLDDVIPDGWK